MKKERLKVSLSDSEELTTTLIIKHLEKNLLLVGTR